MKPGTHLLLRDLGAAPPAGAAPNAAAPPSPAPAGALCETRKERLERGLARVIELRKTDAINAGVTELVARLRAYGGKTAPPAEPDTIGVRVIGTAAKGHALVPLGTVTLELLAGDKQVATARTDTAGVASLSRPPELPDGKYTVRAVAGNGEVIGRFETALHKGQGASHVIELGRPGAALPHIARGERWNEAVERAAKRAVTIKGAVDKSLARVEATLRKALETVAAPAPAPRPLSKKPSPRKRK